LYDSSLANYQSLRSKYALHHRRNGLDATPLAHCRINNRLIKRHSLTDETCFKLISQLFCCLLFSL